MRHPVLLPLLFLVAVFALPIHAAPPSNLRTDILYTTRGEFVQVRPMRPLTLNAHVQQFAYDPLGVEVAFVGSEVQGDQIVHFVKTMDVRTGHEMSRLTVTTPTNADTGGFILAGWSRSGKYLLVQRFAPDPQEPTMATKEYLRWDLSASPSVTRPLDPSAHLPAEAVPVDGSVYGIPSPHCRWIVFRQGYQSQDAAGKLGPEGFAYVLYDPERDTYRLLALPVDARTFEWADDGHLLIRQKEVVQRFDVVTGWVSPLGAASTNSAPAASNKYPDLTLDVEHRLLEDARGSGGHLDSCLLWVRRTLAGRQPLGAASAGLTSGGDDPQAVWSPTGKQIAFLAHGDLCVTNLTTTVEPGPREKMAVGLPLTCAEEKQLAMSSLKQIGLALTQYAQDFDEHYPPTEGLNDAIYPYLKTRDVFQVGSHRFVYQLPGGTSLAKIDSPAETPMGMIDLPCARVVLYVDSHVKSLPKPGVAPAGAN
jgi:hypothetical protein